MSTSTSANKLVSMTTGAPELVSMSAGAPELVMRTGAGELVAIGRGGPELVSTRTGASELELELPLGTSQSSLCRRSSRPARNSSSDESALSALPSTKVKLERG